MIPELHNHHIRKGTPHQMRDIAILRVKTIGEAARRRTMTPVPSTLFSPFFTPFSSLLSSLSASTPASTSSSPTVGRFLFLPPRHFGAPITSRLESVWPLLLMQGVSSTLEMYIGGDFFSLVDL